MTRRTLLLWLLLAAASACDSSAADATGAAEPAANAATCSTDAECSDDLACLPASHACSARGALPYRLSLNVEPPTSDADGSPTPWVQTQWVALDPGAEHERNLTLSTPLVLEGPISLLDRGNSCYVPTSIVATAASDIVGWVDYRFTGTITPDGDNEGWRYQVGVLPDRAYRLTVFIGVDPQCSSAEAAYPPVVVERFVSNSRDRAEIAFIAPPLAEPLVGRLRFDDGEPVAGVKLVASSLDRSTTFGASVTDANGGFQLRLPEGMDQFLLTAKATADFPQFPEQAVQGQFLAGDAAKGAFDLAVPSLPALATLDVRVADASGAPEAAVTLTFTGSVGGGDVTLTTTTDDAGAARVALVPGAYELVAVPPDGARAGAMSAGISVPEAGGDLPLSLPEKVATRIAVLAESTGSAVGGADVFLSLVALPGTSASVERRYHVVADVQGGADARLEPGTWRLLVVPAASTGLPRWGLADVTIDASSLALPVTVPAPWVLHGRVVDPAGQPVANAAIEALATAEANDGEAGAAAAAQGYNDRGLTAVIGEAVTNAEGRFILALPFSR